MTVPSLLSRTGQLRPIAAFCMESRFMSRLGTCASLQAVEVTCPSGPAVDTSTSGRLEWVSDDYLLLRQAYPCKSRTRALTLGNPPLPSSR